MLGDSLENDIKIRPKKKQTKKHAGTKSSNLEVKQKYKHINAVSWLQSVSGMEGEGVCVTLSPASEAMQHPDQTTASLSDTGTGVRMPSSMQTLFFH